MAQGNKQMDPEVGSWTLGLSDGLQSSNRATSAPTGNEFVNGAFRKAVKFLWRGENMSKAIWLVAALIAVVVRVVQGGRCLIFHKAPRMMWMCGNGIYDVAVVPGCVPGGLC